MKPEVKNIISSFIPGTIFIGLLSLIKYYEVSQQVSFSTYGVFPRSFEAITGILTFPLIHKDYDHHDYKGPGKTIVACKNPGDVRNYQ